MTDNIKLPPLPVLGPEWTPHWTKVVHDKMQSYAREAVRLNAQAVPSQAASDAYDRIDHLLRQRLDDHDYMHYSFDLDLVWGAAPAAPQPAQPLTEAEVMAAFDTEADDDDAAPFVFLAGVRFAERTHLGVKND